MSTIQSPLTGGSATLTKKIPTDKLIAAYARYTDVSRFFKGLESIELYTCNDTGYQFFAPFSIAGDGPFYEDLSKEPLYYVPWKDEHTVVDTYIKKGDTVLEQGCATGSFLATEIARKQITAYGTEINEAAKSEARSKGVSFTVTSNSVDVTCSFQVLEHIAETRPYIEEAVSATKPGGYVIFSVPNNDGFLKDDSFCFLNLPPHHMGLWSESSFRKLSAFFPLDFVTAHAEHLQPNHYRSHYQIYFGNKLVPLGFLGKVLNKIIFMIVARPLIARRAAKLPGHTIVAVFKKRA